MKYIKFKYRKAVKWLSTVLSFCVTGLVVSMFFSACMPSGKMENSMSTLEQTDMLHSATSNQSDGYDYEDMEDNQQKATGVVKWFASEKGFGMIIDDSNQELIFVHFSEIENEEKILSEGQRVKFNIKEFQGRLQAANVVIIDEE